MKIDTLEDPKLFNLITSYPLDAETCLHMTMHSKACQFVLEYIVAAGIPGDVAECGVHAGSNLFPLAQLLKAHGCEKEVVAFDTFDGLPFGEDSAGDCSLKKGECRTTLETFLYRAEKFGVEVTPVVGMVEFSLPQTPVRDWSYVFLDMDLKDSTQFAVEYFEDKISKGGIIGFHDYTYHRCPGIAEVVGDLNPEKWQQFGPVIGNAIFFKRK